MFWMIILLILILWLAGAYVPSSPFRDGNVVHLLLVLVVCLIAYRLLGGYFPPSHWR